MAMKSAVLMVAAPTAAASVVTVLLRTGKIVEEMEDYLLWALGHILYLPVSVYMVVPRVTH